MKCKYHFCQNETKLHKRLFKPNQFCSDKCKNKYFVDMRRRKLKIMAVAYKGGQCVRCGYKKSYFALEFHHSNPINKNFSISNPHTKSWDKIKIELDKCELVCSNCHKEIEGASYEFKYQEIIKKFPNITHNPRS